MDGQCNCKVVLLLAKIKLPRNNFGCSCTIIPFFRLVVQFKKHECQPFRPGSDISPIRGGSGKVKLRLESIQGGKSKPAERERCCLVCHPLPLPKPSRLFTIIGRDNDELKKPIYSRRLANTSPSVSALWTSASAGCVVCAHVIMLMTEREKKRGREGRSDRETQWI